MGSPYATILLAILCSSTTAQVAPDFSVTDTDGTEWNLHEQLGLGKTVVLDFFFVDCVPCQSQSPEVSDMYQDYLAANAAVLVLGISNRDADAVVEQFDQTYGITYPTAGEEGGGDTVTTLYQSWFQFFGWPSYGVVCPDTSIIWGILPSVPDVPELRNAVDECLGISSVDDRPSVSEFISMTENRVDVISDQVSSVRFTDLAGRELIRYLNPLAGKSFNIPSTGIILLSIELENHQTIHQKLFR